MTDLELRIMVVLSALVALGGLTIAAWAIKAGQRVIMATGMNLLMLGLGLLVLTLVPRGVLRTSLSVAFFMGALGWVVVQLRFLWIERRDRHTELRRNRCEGDTFG